MRSINFKCDPVFLKGYIYYEDMTPVKNAIVLLEMVLSDCEKNHIKNSSSLYCEYSTTNDCGEFCFKISDKNHYYKIKICENHKIKCSDDELIVIDI